MKRKLMCMSLFLVLLMLGGCAKVIDIATESVVATIVDVEYTPSYTLPMRVGKITTLRTYQEKWETTVQYDGKKYTIDNEDTYNMCKGHEREQAVCTLKTYIYEDDTYAYKITSIDHLN